MTITEQITRAKADYDEVYQAGKKAEYDAFWDSYQQNGERTDYRYAFCGIGWTENNLRPKHPIKVVGDAGNMFTRCGMRRKKAIDLSHLQLDLSEVTSFESGLHDACITNVTLVFSEKIIKLNSVFNQGFGGNIGTGATVKLMFYVPNPACSWTSGFAYAYLLTELILLDGTKIGVNGFNVQWSNNLSHDSIVSIINALSTTTSGLTVTLSKTAVNKAFETSDGANDGSTSTEWTTLIATKSNWTISLV
jgi:hypothetical protein